MDSTTRYALDTTIQKKIKPLIKYVKLSLNLVSTLKLET